MHPLHPSNQGIPSMPSPPRQRTPAAWLAACLLTVCLLTVSVAPAPAAAGTAGKAAPPATASTHASRESLATAARLRTRR
jgi:hypothetical protein